MDFMYDYPSKLKCMFATLKNCSNVMSPNRIVCENHMSSIFHIHYNEHTIMSLSVKAHGTMMYPEEHIFYDNVLPFPYRYTNEKFCIDTDIYERVVRNFVSTATSRNERDGDRIFNILYMILNQSTNPMHDNIAEVSTIMPIVAYFIKSNEHLNRLWSGTTIAMYSNGQITNIPFEKLPTFYKIFFQFAEFDTIVRGGGGNGGDTVVLPPNLLLDLDKHAFVLMPETVDVANVCLYVDEKSLVSPLVLMGTTNQQAGYIPFSRTSGNYDIFKSMVCYANGPPPAAAAQQ